MYSVETLRRPRNSRFDTVAEPFLQQPGLPFAEVLTGAAIERAFARHGGLFAQEDIFRTSIVLWAFPAQVLRGGKGAACAAAVADIATYLQQTGNRVPSGDTGDYCRARSKLNLRTLRGPAVEAAQQLQDGADPSWHRHGLHAKLIDGFTFTMPDTPENQAPFPQQKSQRSGVGFPIARGCAVLSLARAAIHTQQPRQLGFTLACQTILSSWMLPTTGVCRDVPQLWRLALERIAANEVANRPGRIEPRVLKRRRHRYPLLRDPRQKLRQALLGP